MFCHIVFRNLYNRLICIVCLPVGVVGLVPRWVGKVFVFVKDNYDVVLPASIMLVLGVGFILYGKLHT